MNIKELGVILFLTLSLSLTQSQFSIIGGIAVPISELSFCSLTVFTLFLQIWFLYVSWDCSWFSYYRSLEDMAKKRKSEVTGLDEVDRKMHTTFCNAANSLSLLYTHAQNQQKLAFLAGERHGMDKLCQWIIRQHNEGARVTEADILAYLEWFHDPKMNKSKVNVITKSYQWQECRPI
ncbi:hypothetical protein AMTR_s00078p00174210 [Amborella trichopoda]|uniref:Uncharacterized protein n=1 Tax=Amborella trichopoda TaxID=13333 RepID=W1P8F2_AMBTC|nr:hypothetical protein AMTR_s00078p00174210 [Amborella trichopoda]